MSKTQLKKELKNFDREQLAQLVLDIYDARKEARQYLEFFLNPDVNALMAKYRDAIGKELMRGTWRRSKARISEIKKMVKEFDSYGIDAEQSLYLRCFVLGQTMATATVRDFSNAFDNGITTFLHATLEFADKHLMLDKAVNIINGYIKQDVGSNYYKNLYAQEIEGWFETFPMSKKL